MSNTASPRKRARSVGKRRWFSEKASLVWGQASNFIQSSLKPKHKPLQKQKEKVKYMGEFVEHKGNHHYSPPTPRLRSSTCTRTLWLMSVLLDSMKATDDYALSGRLLLTRKFWLQNGVKIVGYSTKITQCKHVCRLLHGLKNTMEFSPEDTEIMQRSLELICSNLNDIQNTMSASVSSVMEPDQPHTPPATPVSVLSDEELSMNDDEEFSLSTMLGNVKTFGLSFARTAKRFANKSLPHRLQSNENEIYVNTCCAVLQYHVLLNDLLHIYSTKPMIIKLIENIIEFMRLCICAFILDDASSFFMQYQRNCIPSLVRLYHDDNI